MNPKYDFYIFESETVKDIRKRKRKISSSSSVDLTKVFTKRQILDKYVKKQPFFSADFVKTFRKRKDKLNNQETFQSQILCRMDTLFISLFNPHAVSIRFLQTSQIIYVLLKTIIKNFRNFSRKLVITIFIL